MNNFIKTILFKEAAHKISIYVSKTKLDIFKIFLFLCSAKTRLSSDKGFKGHENSYLRLL